MSERACGGRALYFTGKKKKREMEVSGSLTSVGTETSLRE